MPFLDRVQHVISASSGADITLGAVYAANALTITQAGGVNGAKYSYVISDGNKFELQLQQVYTSGTGKMARGTPVLAWDGSTASTTQLSSLSGSAVFAIDVLAEDLATFAAKDANSNFSANNLIDGFTTTATAAGTTALTITSTAIQVFTGTTTQTVTLPTTGIVAGQQYLIINASTGAVTVQSSGANTIGILAGGTSALFTALVATPTTAANWNSNYSGVVTASGKVLTASNSITLAGTDGTTMTFPGASASVGYLGVPQNSKSAAYTTVLADAGQHILHPSADTTARTFTIDSNANVAYPIGTAITFVNQISAGVVTIAITSDTMWLAGAGTTGSRTLAANGVATAIKITSTGWIISGVGLT